MKNIIKLLSGIIFCLFISSLSLAQSDERVFKSGDYWDVSAIEVMDGQWLNYADHLANSWRSSMEFAKSKAWIKDYKVIVNTHARDGEADLYLITIFEEWPTKEEEDKRYKAWMEWSEESLATMEKESGERVQMRRLMSDSLLQELHFRK